jgi:hypothetical protein
VQRAHGVTARLVEEYILIFLLLSALSGLNKKNSTLYLNFNFSMYAGRQVSGIRKTDT